MAFGLPGNQVNGIIHRHLPVSYDMSMMMPSKDGAFRYSIEPPIQNIKIPTVVNLLLVASSILQTKVAFVSLAPFVWNSGSELIKSSHNILMERPPKTCSIRGCKFLLVTLPGRCFQLRCFVDHYYPNLVKNPELGT